MRRRAAPERSPWSAVGATVLYPQAPPQPERDAESTS
ncbi:hypothetical protein SAMN04489720_1717 [Agrococcus jejuensis]|uniref:Uncharacterized protein n=1 Tax=Agrococcus jejuensis TaxID=399736 RepID=A0A1G8DNR6_9MICO|nr:hypothetical protein SAMN04489720_1717 [Agrococcus jejuensis]